MTTYILQKDTPNSKAGEEFIYKQNGHPNRGEGYYSESGMYWHKVIVENNPDWFKMKEEAKKHFSAVQDIPATANKPAGRYIDLLAVRSLYNVMIFMGFDYISLDDLIGLVAQKDKASDADLLSLISAAKNYVVKTQRFELAAMIRELEKSIENLSK